VTSGRLLLCLIEAALRVAGGDVRLCSARWRHRVWPRCARRTRVAKSASISDQSLNCMVHHQCRLCAAISCDRIATYKRLVRGGRAIYHRGGADIMISLQDCSCSSRVVPRTLNKLAAVQQVEQDSDSVSRGANQGDLLCSRHRSTW
jgi:hypothetical protein